MTSLSGIYGIPLSHYDACGLFNVPYVLDDELNDLIGEAYYKWKDSKTDLVSNKITMYRDMELFWGNNDDLYIGYPTSLSGNKPNNVGARVIYI